MCVGLQEVLHTLLNLQVHELHVKQPTLSCSRLATPRANLGNADIHALCEQDARGGNARERERERQTDRDRQE